MPCAYSQFHNSPWGYLFGDSDIAVIREEKMKWSGPKNRYKLPGDPNFLTRLWWAIQDYVSFSDNGTIALLSLALALLIIVLVTTPEPS